ncbi:CDGSH iron-sulfur domain-containing protein 2 homolog B-like [Oscarella lobularis]|uniref:CDGSH iron-sulfur domain-containing protein 2 homolog B-like n=1 Tax=Oscarella lobularis TaxID=121494 RepID=UPI003313B451
MESVRNLFHVSLPNYLKSIPIPKDFGGFSELSFNELLRLFAFVVFIALIIFALIRLFFGGGGGGNGNDVTAKTRSSDDKQAGWINASIDKDKNKVATSKDIEELGEKAVFCRCWKSKKFPYCDGSHNKHNQSTGDNVGPLIVKNEKAT